MVPKPKTKKVVKKKKRGHIFTNGTSCDAPKQQQAIAPMTKKVVAPNLKTKKVVKKKKRGHTFTSGTPCDAPKQQAIAPSKSKSSTNGSNAPFRPGGPSTLLQETPAASRGNGPATQAGAVASGGKEVCERDCKRLRSEAVAMIRHALIHPKTCKHPFVPPAWAKKFKPALGRYLQFLKSLPSEFIVVEARESFILKLADGADGHSEKDFAAATPWRRQLVSAWSGYAREVPDASERSLKEFVQPLETQSGSRTDDSTDSVTPAPAGAGTPSSVQGQASAKIPMKAAKKVKKKKKKKLVQQAEGGPIKPKKLIKKNKKAKRITP